MNVSKWIRQLHRWLSIIFTVTVLANFAILGMNESERPMWVVYSPLIPLFLLLFSGLYMFALPYVIRRRGGQSVSVKR
ncbi:hypothetical protein [Phyllobacterium sp. YR531]|uniref:hypothetical protein n=1 Tax=Phyllobacterium sp. YR531 TaxID=1144343 RepID=UPI00026F8758|nr:hypothetical protein [Phyllobacterium sp. YR531]EJN01712.1 hypothetical protein PMI41_03428 [Phyllobacterium sp. YR531]